MEEKYKNRLVEIDNRINDLTAHMTMWNRAGGGRMAMQAVAEIDSLKAEKERILDGSQVKIDNIQEQINGLKNLKPFLYKHLIGTIVQIHLIQVHLDHL